MRLLQRRPGRHAIEREDELARTKAELSRLREELAGVKGALEGLPLGVVLVSPSGKVLTRNARASGLGAGTHGAVLVREAVDKLLLRARSGEAGSTNVELFGPPRRVIQVDTHPLVDGGAIAVIGDVSERARLDAVRTDFVANISHELKTPVGALAVLAETLADEDDPAVVSRIASKIVDEAHRAVQAIDDLLELSRIELGGRAIREPVEVSLLVDDMQRRIASVVEQRGSAIVASCPSGLTVLGDRRQLVSALTNLVANAAKYSEPGSEVTIEARPAGEWVELSVRDRGIGIPARDLDRIFERFYRVDRARSRDTGGTGLGLAIVRHVVNNHEGEISVQSTEGEGSTFTMRLRAA